MSTAWKNTATRGLSKGGAMPPLWQWAASALHLIFISFCLTVSPADSTQVYLSTHSAIRCICIQHRYRQQARKTERHWYVKSLECFHSAITTYWLALLLLELSITNHIQLVSEVTISTVSIFWNISGKFFECTNKQEESQLTGQLFEFTHELVLWAIALRGGIHSLLFLVYRTLSTNLVEG